MLSETTKSLLKRAGHLPQLRVAFFLGCLVAPVVPLLAILLGSILHSLANPESALPSQAPRFASWLPDLATLLPESVAPLGRVSVILLVAVGILLFTSVLLWAFYRQIQIAAVAFEVLIIDQLRGHAKRLATGKTLSAQQQALTDCLDYHLPRVRSSLARWWRTFPRHMVQLCMCILVGILIQPMLAILTLTATGIVVLSYRLLDRRKRTALPVVRERAAQERATLVNLSLKGPLLESVHQDHEIERRFSEQLALYQRDAKRSLTSSAWKTPALILVSGWLACVFVFVISVQILREDAAFSIAAALTFCLCAAGAAISAIRMQRTLRELRTVETAAEELERFLALPVEQLTGESELTEIQGVREAVQLDHVTVQDSRGRKLLENVSATFKPGLLVGVVSSQPLQARALVELLLGYGRPVSGRLLFDGHLVSDLDPASIVRCGHWIAADGAVITGTVRENLLGSESHGRDIDLNDTLKDSRLVEIVQNMPDGLGTIITPNDDRLGRDAGFRLGIGRAKIRNASVVAIEEPDAVFDQAVEQQTLEAIRSLVHHATISVIIPQRLLTLRQCDQVVMVHNHQVVDIGTHADLLQRDELYRHLNYLRFNPFGGGR